MPLALSVVDIETALVSFFTGDADLDAAGCQRVSTDIGGPYPMLRVIRTGGPYDGYRIDRPAVQLEAWGEPDVEDDAVCSAIMRTAAALLPGLASHTFPDLAVSWTTCLTTNQRLPDPTTNQQRRLSTVVISAHAKP
jgi:hypothetical protein